MSGFRISQPGTRLRKVWGVDIGEQCDCDAAKAKRRKSFRKKGVSLFTIAKTGRQPKCPSTDEGIKVIWYMSTMEEHSAIERMQ